MYRKSWGWCNKRTTRTWMPTERTTDRKKIGGQVVEVRLVARLSELALQTDVQPAAWLAVFLHACHVPSAANRLDAAPRSTHRARSACTAGLRRGPSDGALQLHGLRLLRVVLSPHVDEGLSGRQERHIDVQCVLGAHSVERCAELCGLLLRLLLRNDNLIF